MTSLKNTYLSEFRIWCELRNRCCNPNHKQYKNYGARGIEVTQHWQGKYGFQNFLVDMGPKPSPEHSIDRVYNDGNYYVSNCRWATNTQQSRNRRNNRLLTHNGSTKCTAEWAEDLGISLTTLETRLHRGWSTERTLTEPSNIKKRNPRVGTLITYKNKTQNIIAWANEVGIHPKTLAARLKRGVPVEKAIQS